MIWDFLRKRQREEAGALARRQHSAWLTRAMASGRAFPRIPTRPVDLGGFQGQMGRKAGPSRAETWWRLALERVPDEKSE